MSDELFNRLFYLGLLGFFVVVIFFPVMILQVQSTLRFYSEKIPQLGRQLRYQNNRCSLHWIREHHWVKRALHVLGLCVGVTLLPSTLNTTILREGFHVLGGILLITIVQANLIQEMYAIWMTLISTKRMNGWLITLVLIECLYLTGLVFFYMKVFYPVEDLFLTALMSVGVISVGVMMSIVLSQATLNYKE